MEGTTHLLGGVATGMAAVALTNISGGTAAALCAMAAIGSLFPDIDLCTSKAGSKVKPLSFLIGKLFGHRTLFHSPILYIVLYFVARKYIPQYEIWTDAFVLGVASHLMLDMLNRKGIPVFYPNSKRYHLASIKTGSSGETAFRLLLAVNVMFGLVFLLSR